MAIINRTGDNAGAIVWDFPAIACGFVVLSHAAREEESGGRQLFYMILNTWKHPAIEKHGSRQS